MINLVTLLQNPIFQTAVAALVLWEMVWKGFALWFAARNKQTIWFIFILALNTIGILSILYIAFFRKNKDVVVP